MSDRISVLSTQYIRYAVAATVNGATYNPTADGVQFAFLPIGTDPTSGDWVSGSWETVTGPPVQYVARCLIGTANGGHPLAKGGYVVWLKVTDSPEVPVMNVGNLTIT